MGVKAWDQGLIHGSLHIDIAAGEKKETATRQSLFECGSPAPRCLAADGGITTATVLAFRNSIPKPTFI
jgi:hypothetical protein